MDDDKVFILIIICLILLFMIVTIIGYITDNEIKNKENICLKNNMEKYNSNYCKQVKDGSVNYVPIEKLEEHRYECRMYDHIAHTYSDC